MAALRLASRVDPPVVPGPFGADPVERVLVLEHLDHRSPADDWPVGYADALARLHAATTADDVGLLPAWSTPTGEDIGSFFGLARTLGCTVPSAVRTEPDDLLNRLNHASGHALLHGAQGEKCCCCARHVVADVLTVAGIRRNGMFSPCTPSPSWRWIR
ncbi:hypothetical protein [Streptomyces sp. CoT10]|uniref:hypothetical protein n=1 Tax=Streptomyces sp. CoT10 TaxID=2875762 RepID=UPI001CD5EB8F|nr:hypothetical protein [Streptomyces sp. CoT10]